MNYTGLQEYPEGVLSGRYGDYFVNMTWDGTTGIYTVVIDAVPTVPPGLPAQAFLGQMAAQKLADRGYSCTGAHLSARIQGKNSADKTVAKLMTYLDTAVRYLAENGFISGCGSCGRQDAALNLCSVNGEMDFLCPDCFSKVCLLYTSYEIVDNAVDEHLAGCCTQIRVVLEDDGSCTVTDNGRGIPVGMHEKGVPAERLVFTTLHAGGKFDNTVYKTSGGLHGVGSSVVNALSTYLDIQVSREGFVHHDRYERGVPVIALEDGLLPKIGKTRETGTLSLIHIF